MIPAKRIKTEDYKGKIQEQEWIECNIILKEIPMRQVHTRNYQQKEK